MQAARAGLLSRVGTFARPLLARTKQAFVRFSGSAPGSGTKPASFAEAGQFDSGFYQGTSLLAGVLVGSAVIPFETQREGLRQVVSGFRTLGLGQDVMSDEVLVRDYLRKNALAAQNVLIASPTFYFLFSYITGQNLAVCAARSVTGTMRIVPFMGLFYGAFACLAPFATQLVMKTTGKSYDESVSQANIALMLGGFVFVEAVVELRGCGVTFAQMTLSSFAVFVPALVGRLAAGVLTQQSKVGTESVPVVPPEWADGTDWQRQAFRMSKVLCLDVDFFTTAAGTSVFQHILNAVTFVLLAKGNKSSLGDIAKFLLFGVNNTLASGAAQTLRTFFMRTLFGLSWNMASSQSWDTPVFDAAVREAQR